jgi:two-component system chemotaxis sensor kinase CheA
MGKALTFDIQDDELDIFVEDVNELLQEMESGILRLEQEVDPDTLNSAFRAAHTLKAVAGTVGHQAMAELTHTAETLFDAMREAKITPAQAVIDELLAAVDILKALRDEVITRQPSGIDATACLARLRELTEAGDGKGSQATPAAVGRQLTPEQTTQAQSYHQEGLALLEVEATVGAEAFAPAARLMQAAMALAEAGEVIAQQPMLADLLNDWQNGWLWAVVATERDTASVEGLLSDVSDLEQIQVQPYQFDRRAAPSASDSEPSTSPWSSGPGTEGSGQGPSTGPWSSGTCPGRQALGPLAQGQRVQGPGTEGSGQGPALAADTTVRISVERLDILMNLVGELVTGRNSLLQIEDTLRAQYGRNGVTGTLSEMAAHFDRVVDQLQDEVMRARMLPIGRLFAKFPRLVRDVARAEGKEVKLVIEGEATELDRSVIEGIGDPLIHLLRNAVDHGIESPQERAAAGKPPAGTIWLTAAHVEGQIVITVQDDGGGIDPDRVRRVAVSRGFMSEEEAAQLDDDEAISLIFQPNLSTAEQVTEVSGRGVGLDVVRTNVERLGGMVLIDSQVGRGTTFRITLPLTLAIVQNMLVALGDNVFAIPLAGILDSLYLEDVTIHTVKGTPTIRWRDSVLPLLDLRKYFADPRLGAAPSNGAKPAVVTVAWGKLRLGLVADGIIGQQEIVVKSLSSIVGNTAGLSGCAILGDGRIALILDIPGLIDGAMQARKREAA